MKSLLLTLAALTLTVPSAWAQEEEQFTVPPHIKAAVPTEVQWKGEYDPEKANSDSDHVKVRETLLKALSMGIDKADLKYSVEDQSEETKEKVLAGLKKLNEALGITGVEPVAIVPLRDGDRLARPAAQLVEQNNEENVQEAPAEDSAEAPVVEVTEERRVLDLVR